MTMLELAERLATPGSAGSSRRAAAGPDGRRPIDDPSCSTAWPAFEIEVTGLRALCRDLVERHEAGTAGRPTRRS